VAHGHLKVNGHKVDIASYECKQGDVITVKDSPRSQQLVGRFLEMTQGTPIPDWVTVDRDAMKGTINRLPIREDINPIVNEQLIVELYSR
jgi:small subunit ribosomal protein S4